MVYIARTTDGPSQLNSSIQTPDPDGYSGHLATDTGSNNRLVSVVMHWMIAITRYTLGEICNPCTRESQKLAATTVSIHIFHTMCTKSDNIGVHRAKQTNRTYLLSNHVYITAYRLYNAPKGSCYTVK